MRYCDAVAAAVVVLLHGGVHGAVVRRALVVGQRHLMGLVSLRAVLVRFPGLPFGRQRAASTVLGGHESGTDSVDGFGRYYHIRAASGRRDGVRLWRNRVRVRVGEGVAGVWVASELHVEEGRVD